MDIKTAVKTAIQAAGKNNVKIADFLGISKQAFSIFLSGELNQIERLIKICNFCGCDIIITDHQNINIKLSTNSQEKSESK